MYALCFESRVCICTHCALNSVFLYNKPPRQVSSHFLMREKAKGVADLLLPSGVLLYAHTMHFHMDTIYSHRTDTWPILATLNVFQYLKILILFYFSNDFVLSSSTCR